MRFLEEREAIVSIDPEGRGVAVTLSDNLQLALTQDSQCPFKDIEEVSWAVNEELIASFSEMRNFVEPIFFVDYYLELINGIISNKWIYIHEKDKESEPQTINEFYMTEEERNTPINWE